MGIWSDLAAWRGPTPNQGGAMYEVRGVVLHIAEGTFEGTIAWQYNQDASVSSHFVAAKDGRAAQMVDTDRIAWTQVDGNGHWLSVEHEGHSGDLLTAAQFEFDAQVLARAHQVYGVPLQLADSPTGRGLGYHAMGGNSWGGHFDCPGSPIIGQRSAVIARAQQILSPTPPAPPVRYPVAYRFAGV